MGSENAAFDRRVPWNNGKLTGQKPPLNSISRSIASSSLRSHAIAGAGRPARKPRGRESTRHATEDPASGPIRDHGANP